MITYEIVKLLVKPFVFYTIRTDNATFNRSHPRSSGERIRLEDSIKADDRTRTDNLLITNQLLCQLSHIGTAMSL